MRTYPEFFPGAWVREFQLGSWEILPIFKEIQRCGEIALMEMFATFNMGIGMMMFVSEEDGQKVVEALAAVGEGSENHRQNRFGGWRKGENQWRSLE